MGFTGTDVRRPPLNRGGGQSIKKGKGMEKVKRATLETLRAEYAALTRQLAAIDSDIDDMRARREIVAKQRDLVNRAAISILSELEGAAE